MNISSCTTSHHHVMRELSIFTAAASGLLLISTLVLNLLLVTALLRNKKRLHKYMFYRMLLNISVADLLTAMTSDSISLSFHIKEALRQYILQIEVTLLHCGLFFINGASILTLALICVDRLIALLRPTLYIEGVKRNVGYLMISLTWICSALLCVPYFYVGYIKYLMVFSCGTVIIAFAALMITVITYKQNLRPTLLSSNVSNVSQSEVEKYVLSSNDDCIHKKRLSTIQRPLSRMISNEEKTTISFIIMLIVFLFTYLPATMMTAYMNLCQKCNCDAIHVLRDLTYLSILSSAFWRPLNFIMRLNTVRRDILEILVNIKKMNFKHVFVSQNRRVNKNHTLTIHWIPVL